jgi:2,4-dienoyl-CoA reductase-like NADH-dependent reductase (Old Yellow Enzyme family)
MDVSNLFEPLTLRGTNIRNRVWVSPMCQYSSHDGRPSDWHLVHLGAFAQGGAGLVMSEATAVTPEGRISPQDAGIWNDEQAADYRRITDFVKSQGATPGIQLAHAGRKASTRRPWEGRGYVPESEGGWQTVGASPIGYADWPAPRELTAEELAVHPQQWADAARRALDAGYEVAEVHAAHGYLLHQFLSPLTNRRTDGWGGDLAGRSRLLLDVVDAVREVWPDDRPVFVRISATDWVEGGLYIDETAEVARLLAAHGVDLVDVSTGGNSPDQRIPLEPGYQVPFATRIRQASGLPVGAVGLITEPQQAEKIVSDGEADAVFLARELLRDPHWAQRAAEALGADTYWPEQYLRARP